MADNHTALRTMAGWIAAIADNVKNPIAGIGAALTIAEDQLARRADGSWDANTLEQSLSMIRVRLSSLSEYVGELVDFAKPSVPDRARLDTILVLRLATSAVKGSDRYGINFQIHVEPGADVLLADGAQIHRALVALLVNAVEALGHVAAPCIHLTAKPGESPGAVAIEVEDNGPGMRPEVAARATEPFYSTKEAGTGLGLTLVERCVRGHGGTIAIGRGSTLGGCRVRLDFPCVF